MSEWDDLEERIRKDEREWLVEEVLRHEQEFQDVQWWAKTHLATCKWFGGQGTARLSRDIYSLLEQCERIGVPPPKELVEVAGRQLEVLGWVRDEVRLKGERAAAIRALARNPKLSNRTLARDLHVSPHTIADWKKDPLFDLEMEWLSAHPHNDELVNMAVASGVYSTEQAKAAVQRIESSMAALWASFNASRQSEK
jgi:hypothetical protein